MLDLSPYFSTCVCVCVCEIIALLRYSPHTIQFTCFKCIMQLPESILEHFHCYRKKTYAPLHITPHFQRALQLLLGQHNHQSILYGFAFPRLYILTE